MQRSRTLPACQQLFQRQGGQDWRDQGGCRCCAWAWARSAAGSVQYWGCGERRQHQVRGAGLHGGEGGAPHPTPPLAVSVSYLQLFLHHKLAYFFHFMKDEIGSKFHKCLQSGQGTLQPEAICLVSFRAMIGKYLPVTTYPTHCNNKYLLLQRFSVIVTTNIWMLHCYNLFILLQRLFVVTILLQQINVVTIWISCNNVTFKYLLLQWLRNVVTTNIFCYNEWDML